MKSHNRIIQKQFNFNRQIILPSCSNSTNKNIEKLLIIKYSTKQKNQQRFSSFLRSSYLIQLMLLISFLAIVEGQFSSNEDKRNNFEREFLSFGKRETNLAPIDLERNFMNFGKRANKNYSKQFIAFSKRYAPVARVIEGPFVYEKANFNREIFPFGKRTPNDFQRDFMSFGRRK